MKRVLRDQFKNAYISKLHNHNYVSHIHSYIHTYKNSLLQSLSKHANMKRELRDQFKNAYISKLQESQFQTCRTLIMRPIYIHACIHSKIHFSKVPPNMHK